MGKTENTKTFRLSKLATESLTQIVGDKYEIMFACYRALEMISPTEDHPLLMLEQFTLNDVSNVPERFREFERAGVNDVGLPQRSPDQTPLELAGEKLPDITLSADEDLFKSFETIGMVAKYYFHTEIPLGDIISARIVFEILTNPKIKKKINYIPAIVWKQSRSNVYNISRTYLHTTHFVLGYEEFNEIRRLALDCDNLKIRCSVITSDGEEAIPIYPGYGVKEKFYPLLLDQDFGYKVHYRRLPSGNVRIGFRGTKTKVEVSAMLRVSECKED